MLCRLADYVGAQSGTGESAGMDAMSWRKFHPACLIVFDCAAESNGVLFEAFSTDIENRHSHT